MKRLMLLTAILASFAALSGCAFIQKPAAVPTPTFGLLLPTPTLEVQMPTEIPLPTAALPTLAPTPSLTPTPQAVLPVEAVVVFDNFILRAGPGRLFERVSLYPSGTQVWVLARAMGVDWVMARTGDNRVGWMNTAGLDHLGDFSALPIYSHPGTFMLSGHVWNTDGSPAPGIGIRLVPAGSADDNLREDVTTGADGAWYAYLPGNSSGEWEVHAVSYSCAPDVPAGQCAIKGSLPASMLISLPEALNVNIEMKMQP